MTTSSKIFMEHRKAGLMLQGFVPAPRLRLAGNGIMGDNGQKE